MLLTNSFRVPALNQNEQFINFLIFQLIEPGVCFESECMFANCCKMQNIKWGDKNNYTMNRRN